MVKSKKNQEVTVNTNTIPICYNSSYFEACDNSNLIQSLLALQNKPIHFAK